MLAAATVVAGCVLFRAPAAFATETSGSVPASVPVTAVPQAFSPDGDGINDRVGFNYTLPKPGHVSVSVWRGTAFVRTLRPLSSSALLAGPHITRWDGRGRNGALVRNAMYTVKLKAVLGTETARSSAPVRVARVKRWIGFYMGNGVPRSMTPLMNLEKKIRRRAGVVHYFQYVGQDFNWNWAARCSAHGAVPLITLEFRAPSDSVRISDPRYRLKRVSSGAFDGLLRRLARRMKSFGRPIWIQPFHEMNGTWYPWGVTVNGNRPSDFAPAWRHVRQVFTNEGATNVKFVWTPNAESVPSWAGIKSCWPGDAYIDYVAIDGYNWGTAKSWGHWAMFSEIYRTPYRIVTRLTKKPVFIGETGCTTRGGNKAAWIRDMFRVVPTRFPRLRGIVYWNSVGSSDWRLDSDAKSVAAFRAGAASANY